jgi:hypothetical protein
VPHIANISEIGARRRRRGGFVWLGVALAALAIMIAYKLPHADRLALVVPFGLAATGFLQSREKT